MKAAFFLLFLLVLTQAALPVRGQTASRVFRLGFVKSFDDMGDSIWLATTKKKDRIDEKAIARLGYATAGKININGRDIELKRVKDFMPDRNFKLGRGGYQIWKGSNTVVRLDYVFTWLCPPRDEACEVFYYKGVMAVTYKKQRRKVQIRGFGGT